MKEIQFSYENTADISQQELQKATQKLSPEIGRIRQALSLGYETIYASINVSKDLQMRRLVQTVATEKKKLKPAALIVIGIGGSNLGTVALVEALLGKMYNQKTAGCKVYFADTVDADYCADLLEMSEKLLQAGKEIILFCVTKSGATTETIANFELFLALLQKYRTHNFGQYVVVATDKDSVLWKIATEMHLACLEIPRTVGGRFSVLSPVGLFPLALLGIDIDQLHAGAADALSSATSDNTDNSSALSALIKYIHYQRGIRIDNQFVFSIDLESLGKWYRQLMGESLGKDALQGTEKKIGIVPTVSIGSIDLHSVGQLYLGGPHNIYTTFVTVAKNRETLKLPTMPIFEQAVGNIQGRSVAELMDAIVDGVKAAYVEEKLPFCEMVIPEKNAFYLGYYLQMYMIEMMYLAFLLDVNPFDQPHVELYKKETRKILAHG